MNKENLSSGGFGIFIENPNRIYTTLRQWIIEERGYKNITALMRDPDRQMEIFTLEPQIKSDLIDHDEMEFSIDTEMGPFCRMNSTVFLRESALAYSPYGFYNLQKKEVIRQLMGKNRLDVEWDRQHRNLEVKRLDEVIITLDFGWASSAEKIRFLTKTHGERVTRLERLVTLDAPKRIIDKEKEMIKSVLLELDENKEYPSNDKLKIRMDNIWRRHGGKGTSAISFRQPEIFVKNLRYYADIYESFIRALHTEASLQLPDSPIIISADVLKYKDLYNSDLTS